MNARYFKEQICEELDGASSYLKKAIDCFMKHPDWSKKFAEMSEAEQHHATNLYKMFMEMYAESQGQDPYMTAMRDGIMDCFSSSMRKIEDLRTTLDMMMHKEKRENINIKTEQPKTWAAPVISTPSESSTLKAISD